MTQWLSQIQARFNKANTTYESVATVQRQAAEFLATKILAFENFTPTTILDVGTGTGYLPEILLPRYPHSTFYLNDIAGEMLHVCQSKLSHYPNVYYLHADMMQLQINPVDLVTSNLALQWSDQLSEVLELLYSKSSSVFAFSTLLEGTFKEWEKRLNTYHMGPLLRYPRPEDLMNICNSLKKHDDVFDYEVMDIPLFFDSSVALIYESLYFRN